MSETKTKTKEPQRKEKKKEKYIEGIGRRKRSTARVRIYASTPLQSVEKKGFLVNKNAPEKYFTDKYRDIILSPLRKLNLQSKFKLTIMVNGGGTNSSAEAIRMGLARALVTVDATHRKQLKAAGYLKRDPREKERKKPGLKKARRAPQWKKR